VQFATLSCKKNTETRKLKLRKNGVVLDSFLYWI